MATVRFEVTIRDDRGNVMERFPSTTKVFANRIARLRAKQLQGYFSVVQIDPIEYDPKQWQ